MTRTATRKPLIVLILGLLMTITPFAVDMYLTSFLQIAKDLGTTPSKLPLTVTGYFVGLALGQLFYGPLLDRFGRSGGDLCRLLGGGLLRMVRLADDHRLVFRVPIVPRAGWYQCVGLSPCPFFDECGKRLGLDGLTADRTLGVGHFDFGAVQPDRQRTSRRHDDCDFGRCDDAAAELARKDWGVGRVV